MLIIDKCTNCLGTRWGHKLQWWRYRAGKEVFIVTLLPQYPMEFGNYYPDPDNMFVCSCILLCSSSPP